jgi:hypothetical protein
LRNIASELGFYNRPHFLFGDGFFFADSRHPRSLILTHGLFKPPKKTLKREINKALNFRKEYLAQKTIKTISL